MRDSVHKKTGFMTVPFGNLHAQYRFLKDEIDHAIAAVIEESAFIRGPFVDTFEESFATAVGSAHCVSCGDGTTAIYIALVALGVNAGDEVIVPAMSWISTSETVTQVGGKVVFCDIDQETHGLDLEKLEKCIGERTVGIIPVHLHGYPVAMDRVMEIAASYKLWVIEDTAQAHLARYNGRTVGTFGHAGTFSFFPGKNLGAMGDAGAIVTNDGTLAEKMARFARHGGIRKGEHLVEGINSRLDGLQASILNVKLPHLAAWNERRCRIAHRYTERLRGILALRLPVVRARAEPVWHHYIIMTEDREGLADHLRHRGVDTSIYYPTALPFLPCYRRFGFSPGDFPVAHWNQRASLALPMYAELTDEAVDYVCEQIAEYFDALPAC